MIISTQYIHPDHHNCLEIVAAQGMADEVKRLAAKLKSIKGVNFIYEKDNIVRLY